MRFGLLIATFGLGLILGGGAGRLLFNSKTPLSAPAAGTKPVSAPRKIPGPVRSAPAEPIPPALSKILGAIPVDVKVPPGTGVISGEVKTKDGRPLADVRISARRQDEAEEENYADEEAPEEKVSLERQVLAIVRRVRREEANRSETTTDASGAYALKALPDGVYFLSADAEGYEVTANPSQRSWNVRPGATVSFTAKPVLKVPVTVLLPGGLTAPKAKIDIVTRSLYGSSTDRRYWSSNHPVISVTPGKFTLIAHSGEKEEFSSDSQKVAFTAGQPPAALTFHLKSRPGVHGRVTQPAGVPAGEWYFRVYLLKTTPGSAPDPEQLVREGRSTLVGGHDEGAYRFNDILPGVYLVGAGYNNNQVAVTATVTVADSMAVQDLVVPAPAPEDFLAVWVRGPDGSVLDDVSFEVITENEHSTRNIISSQSLARPDGAFLVSRHDGNAGENDAKAARYILKVTSEDFGQKSVSFSAADRELSVQFGEAATVDVLIKGYAGSGYEGKLSLALKPPLDPKSDFADLCYFAPDEKVSTSPEGVQTLGPVQPGAWEIVLSVGADRSGESQVARVPVTLVAGENKATVPIPALYTLTVIFDKAEKKATVVLCPTDRSGGYSRNWCDVARKDQTAVFENVPAGRYDIRVYGDMETEQMSVTVAETTRVHFQAQPLNALLVTVSDPQGALAAAGFQTGDLIAGVNGTEFEDEDQMMTLKMSAKDDAKWVVIRGNQAAEIVFPFRKIGSAKLGGDCKPTSR